MDDPKLTQDWKDHVEKTLEEHDKAVDDYKSFKSWLLGLGAGIGAAIGFFAKEVAAALTRH